mmetsp:Transcript_11229/g.16546  ORF Transcript_11229/g.16546 Transcript_11229/m.16546 type:complete len:207 (+) Transcript_11229:138-758(+)
MHVCRQKLRHWAASFVFQLLCTLVCPPRSRAPLGLVRKYGDEFVDFLAHVLYDAFRDPHQVTDLLLLELHIGIEGTKVHLALEGELQHLHVALVEGVVDGLVAEALVLVGEEDLVVLAEGLQGLPQLLVVGGLGQDGGARRVQVADGRVQALAVRPAHGRLVQRGVEGVEGDVDGNTVSPGLQNVAHHFSCVSTNVHAILIEVLQV